MASKAKKLGIKLHNLDSPPRNEKFDIIQINHQPIGERLLSLFPNNKFINIVRSRILPIEYPLIDRRNRIKKYIAINEVVEKFMVEKYEEINADNIEMIYNITKDKRVNKKTLDIDIENFVLLPGTMNYLRKNMVYDITEKTKLSGKKLVLVGNDHDFGYAKKLSTENEHVIYYDEMSDLSGLLEKCDKICGLYLGRTLIEGFKYNKKGIGYLVDMRGEIEEIKEDIFPKDMDLFETEYITEQYINLYKEVINEMEEKINIPITKITK